jgi:exosome complex component RRP43
MNVLPSVDLLLEKTSESFRVLEPLAHYREALENTKVRPDGRAFLETRELSVSGNTIGTADGSAEVRIGSTCVVAGIKLEIGEPNNINEPAHGNLDIDVQLQPFCSQRHKFGAYSEEALTMGEFVRRTILSKGAIDLADLCIEENVCVWSMKVDVVCLDDDGSVVDAALIATYAALYSLELPALRTTPNGNGGGRHAGLAVVSKHESLPEGMEIKYPTRRLPTYQVPYCMSFGVFEKKVLIADPSAGEENLVNPTFVCVGVVSEDECKGNMSMYKVGGDGVALSVMKDAFAESRRSRMRELQACLRKALA